MSVDREHAGPSTDRASAAPGADRASAAPGADRASAAPGADRASAAPGPLSGIRVVDCSTVLAGPYATMLLGDLGADVIKVEPPDGDATRGWGPPWVGHGSGADQTAAYYLSVNRNKRSIRLDLRQDAGRAILRRLIARADVLVENFRAGGMVRLGLDDAELSRLNGGLIHLAISGYGAASPDPARPGYDFVIQAESGLMSITGPADGEPGAGPFKVGVAISDVITGLNGAVGILAALIARGGEAREADAGGQPGQRGQRGQGSAHGGRGQRVDVSLLGATLAALVNQAQNAFASDVAPARLGNAHPNIVPYETFETSDGTIAVAVGSERQWPRFCIALGLPALADDPRFATNGDRVTHRADLIPTLAGRFATRATAEWLVALDAADIPAGPINDVVEAFASRWAVGRTIDVDHPQTGTTRQVAPAIELSVTPATVRAAPPSLGEHTAQILAELGEDDAAIEALRRAGVV